MSATGHPGNPAVCDPNIGPGSPLRGEEFACILPETDRLGAFAVAEKIRRNILAQAIPHQASTVADYVTASLGVLTVCCEPSHSPLKSSLKWMNCCTRPSPAVAIGLNRGRRSSMRKKASATSFN